MRVSWRWRPLPFITRNTNAANLASSTSSCVIGPFMQDSNVANLAPSTPSFVIGPQVAELPTVGKLLCDWLTENAGFCSSLVFCISEKTVYTAIEKGKSEEVKDNRGQHENRPQKMSVSTEQSVTAHIKQFPVKESHYVRRDTKKLYLEKTLNISKKYRLYSDEWFMGANYPNYVKMATKRQYDTVFNTKFNYSFHKPKKDMCGQCTLYRQADGERKEQLQEAYTKHIRSKECVVEILRDEGVKWCKSRGMRKESKLSKETLDLMDKRRNFAATVASSRLRALNKTISKLASQMKLVDKCVALVLWRHAVQLDFDGEIAKSLLQRLRQNLIRADKFLVFNFNEMLA
ncbi:hypothetical protein ACJJTC_009665 [Scirpophaga incertulas]